MPFFCIAETASLPSDVLPATPNRVKQRGPRMVTLYELMRRKPSKIRHDARVKEAAWQMQDRRIGALLVEDNGRLVGCITEMDVASKANAEGRDLTQIYVHQIMNRLVRFIEASRSPREALEMMAQYGVSHVVVTEAGRVVGVVSDRDILSHFKPVLAPNIDVA